VWVFVVRGSDVYITPSLLGGQAKVSLHASGQFQYSYSDSWVTALPGRRNADRHIKKWSLPRQLGREAANVFHVRIPESDLQALNLEEDLSSVRWLPTPAVGETVSLECYITSASDGDPTFTAYTPHPCVVSLPLADGRWFVVLNCIMPLNGLDLGHERKRLRRALRAAGVEALSKHRYIGFLEHPGSLRGLVELSFCH
jgi:hypothetical protein